jgi:hypothetical protein
MAMQAGILMGTYIVTTIVVQFVGFLVSQLVEYEFPNLGLLTFLILFIGAFGLAWPLAVFIAERLIQKLGHELEKNDPRAT